MRSTRLALLLLTVTIAAPSARGQRMGHYTLDPKSYTSPSGKFVLRVNPSTIYGQGEGEYRLTNADKEIWAKKLPFTLWEAAVTDDGTAAGYAYSLGMENYPLDREKREDGKLHMLILDPRGEVRMNEVLPRRGNFTCTSTIDRNATGLILDPENDRFLIRCREGGWVSNGEVWRFFKLSTGKLVDEFQFRHPQETEHENWFILATQAVAGTPLILVNWKYSKWDSTGNQIRATGGKFNLIDASGKPVWELDRPGDYPEYYEFSKRLNSEKDSEESTQLMELERWIDQHSAILRSDQPSRFDLWFVKDKQRVTFEVRKSDEAWTAVEVNRAACDPRNPDKKSAPDALEKLALRHLGTIQLQIKTAAAPEIRDIEYFDLDDRDRIGLLRNEPDRSTSFLLIDAQGTVLRKVGLKATFGENYNLPKATWLEGDSWLLIARTWDKAPEGEISKAVTRAWWLNAADGRLRPLEPFPGQGARRIASTRDGGFVVAIDPPLGSNQAEAVAAFDREGKELWRRYPASEEGVTFGTSGVTVTTDGKVVVERGYGDRLTFFDARGKYLKTVDCESLFGNESSGADSVSADRDGGLIVATKYSTGKVFRIRKDLAIDASFAIKHADGRPVELVGFPDQIGLRVSKAGALWACDKHSLLRLSSAGVVEQVLGEAPDSPELRRISRTAIDQAGNIYLAEERNGITHVFNDSGRSIRVLRPNPSDFKDPWGIDLDVAFDGSVSVGGLWFSPQGERIGFKKLAKDLEESMRFDGHRLSHPHSPRSWIVSGGSATLLDEEGKILHAVNRHSDGKWLDRIEIAAVAPDGALAVSAGSFGMGEREKTISVFSASGEPVATAPFPNIPDTWPIADQMAFSGRFVLTGAWGFKTARYAALDVGVTPPRWYDLGDFRPYDDQWHYFFVKEGKELWLLAENARKVERYEIVAASTVADSKVP